MNAIRPKVVLKGKQHDEHAKRYVFYPLSNLDFAGSQWMSPVWIPKMPKGRIILLESFEYQAQVANEGESGVGFNGVALGERTMGTDAQVKFLMGNSEGTGWMEKGMTHLDSITDVDPTTVVEIEEMIIPDGVVPDTVIEYLNYLNTVSIKGDSPVAGFAKSVLVEMKDGVNRAINWCKTYTNQLEQELRDGQAGGIGIKYLSETNKYYFAQINKPLPEDRVGVNMGAELSKVLAPLMQGTTPDPEALQKSVEAEEMAKKLEAETKRANDLAEVVEALQSETNDTGANPTN